MRVEMFLDRLHARAVTSRWLVLFTAGTRALLALAFLPSGFVKLIGHRFTTLPTTDPVGYFFDAFFRAAGYYRFVGAAQLLAALLLLHPSTSPLGAVIYFTIALNIFVITLAVDFAGTEVVTGLMTLASLYLLCWHYDRWKTLLPGFGPYTPAATAVREPRVLTLALALAAGLGFTGVTGVHLARLRHTPMQKPMLLLAGGACVGLLTLWSYLRSSSKARPGRGDTRTAGI
jgi:hypothetical protein